MNEKLVTRPSILSQTAIADSPYFKTVMESDFKVSKRAIALFGKERMSCRICGETDVTLYRDGERDGQKLYICKDCKLIQLSEEEEKEEDN